MTEGLTDKQRLFVEHYVACLNGTEAARRAGYAESGIRVQAHRLLTNANVRAEIDARMAELAMPPNEILARLTDYARGSMADFLSIKGRGVTLDLKKAAAAGQLHLIKKYSKTKQGVSVELYSAYDAQVKLGEHYRLWVQRQEVSGPGGGPIELSDARSQLAAALATALTPGNASPAPGGDRDAAASDSSALDQ